jgi:hypothetical protein
MAASQNQTEQALAMMQQEMEYRVELFNKCAFCLPVA